MHAVLTGEIEGFTRVDADVVEIVDLTVRPNAVLLLPSGRNLRVRDNGRLVIEGRRSALGQGGQMFVMRSAWSPSVAFARARAWVSRVLGL